MITKKKLIFCLLLPPFTLALVYITVHASNVLQGGSSYVHTYRLYRALYSSLAGCILAIAGCILQSALRNPLVDHHVLGVGSGALFASYISILLYSYTPLLATTFAIIGGLIALALTVIIAEGISGSDVAYVLSGISVTSLFSGLSIFLSYYVTSRYPYAGLMLSGSFVLSRPDYAPYVSAALVLALFGYTALSKKLNVILLGDDHATQLGVKPRHVRFFSALITGLSSSIIVATFGLIGFVGLITPHISRFLSKTSDNRVIVPIASSIGALLLYAADLFSKYVVAPVAGEVPAGALVSLIGSPFFLLLVVKRFKGRVL
ncbi:MAG: iron ABC transporter permease [Desulfurococcaceae archaeon]